MNHTKKKYILSMLTSFGMATLLMTSCGSDLSDDKTETKNKSMQVSTNQEEVEKETVKTEVPEEVQKLLDLGTYEGNIALNGEKSSEDEVKVSNGHCIFPQCSVRTMIASNVGTNPTFVNVSKDEVKKLVSLLEKTKVKDEGTTFSDMNIDPDEFSLEATLQFVLLNSKGEYNQVSLVAFKGDTVKVRLAGEEYCFMPNKDLTQTIKRMTNYRVLEDKDLKKLTKMEVLYKDTNKSYSLSEEELKKVINGLKDRERVHEFTDWDAEVLAKTNDGDSVSMKVSERERQVAIEGASYNAPDEVIKILMKGR